MTGWLTEYLEPRLRAGSTPCTARTPCGWTGCENPRVQGPSPGDRPHSPRRPSIMQKAPGHPPSFLHQQPRPNSGRAHFSSAHVDLRCGHELLPALESLSICKYSISCGHVSRGAPETAAVLQTTVEHTAIVLVCVILERSTFSKCQARRMARDRLQIRQRLGTAGQEGKHQMRVLEQPLFSSRWPQRKNS
ncbi:hypothetical protein HJG60_011117 [Phyllostomus discolor]|uniref:Uncharacterized protein n=1 Tax=Phyllostomus discolor TaxID=89673 RepID=A0A834A445_9CHIR|nr:hypothetical protein HJG60_011117 [Phyllostomus discolor]